LRNKNEAKKQELECKTTVAQQEAQNLQIQMRATKFQHKKTL
jgi:hypothetical protein